MLERVIGNAFNILKFRLFMLIIRKHGVRPPLTGRCRKSEAADLESRRAVIS